MSFLKSLKCFFCSRHELIFDAGFPEDLFDLITKYKIEQLFWLCESCKNKGGKTTFEVSAVLNKQNNIEEPSHSLRNEFEYVSVSRNCEERTSWSEHDQNDSRIEAPRNCEPKILNVSCASPKILSRIESVKEDKSNLKYVQQILKTIKIDPQEQEYSRKIVQSVLTCLLTNLKKNDEFAVMFSKFFYTGSSYNDLRISSASEYDIDLVLKIPKNVKLTPVFPEAGCSFGKLKFEVMDNDNTNLPVKFLKSKSKDSYLMPEMISSWLQSQIDIVLNQKFEYPIGVSKIKSIENGPARTIVVETDIEFDLSIDIVPVFEFEYSVLEGTSIFSKLQKTGDINRDKWFMIPKKCQGEIDVTYSHIDYYWRSVFPNAEKFILHGKECAKSVIKILKLFRDKKDWKGLASYYLNMVVILEVIKNPDANFWKNGNLFQRLLDAFNQLRNYLKDQNLPHFLTNQNLLYKFNEDLCKNWCNHLNRVILTLESNPNYLIEHLNEREEESDSSCTLS